MIREFGLHRYQVALLTSAFMDQIEACRDDDARRLLLGRNKVKHASALP